MYYKQIYIYRENFEYTTEEFLKDEKEQLNSEQMGRI